ncbi:phage holin family protein [Bacteroidota bacterium]
MKFLKLDKILDNLTGYVETKLELYRIQFKEEVAKAIGVLVLVMVMIAVFGLMIVFLSLAIANHLNTILDSNFIGFLIIAIVYLIFGVLIIKYREKLIFNWTYRLFFTEEEEESIDEDEINS